MYFYFIKIVLLVKMCCGKFSGGVENTIQHLIIRTLFTNLYNRGIQMYRFPNSDVQKSVIFEGIKKRLKIV